MSELDQIMYYLRELTGRPLEEVQYLRCKTLSEVITVALDFDRSHPPIYSQGNAHDRQMYRSHDTSHQYRSNNGPEAMDISNVKIPSRDEFRRRNFSFKFGSPNHRCAKCNHRRTCTDKTYNRSDRKYQQHANQQHVNNVDSR